MIIFLICISLLLIGGYIWNERLKYKRQVEWLIKYDVIIECDKLFITDHYKCLQEVSLLDFSDFQKKKIIRINRYCTNDGEESGLTRLINRAAILKIRGEDKWEY